MPYDVAKLLTLSQAELDQLFSKSPVGNIPDGEGEGTAIVAPGTTYSDNIARFVSHFAWQGKVFDAKKGVLKNKILPFGLNAILAKVYKGPSWLDGKECIVLDYSDTSVIAQWIRDEIRQIDDNDPALHEQELRQRELSTTLQMEDYGHPQRLAIKASHSGRLRIRRCGSGL